MRVSCNHPLNQIKSVYSTPKAPLCTLAPGTVSHLVGTLSKDLLIKERMPVSKHIALLEAK